MTPDVVLQIEEMPDDYESDSTCTPEAFELVDGEHVSFKRTNFDAVLERVNAKYDQDIVHRYSAAVDALASFVKGQKHMYMEGQGFAMHKLQCLMIPALIASAIEPILIQADSIQCTEKGKIIIGTLAGFVTCMIGIITLMRLDAEAEAHRTSAHQYDKLQSLLEFQSGQVLLFSDPTLAKQGLARELRKGQREVAALERIYSLSDEEESKGDTLEVKTSLTARVKKLRRVRRTAEDLLTKKMSTIVKTVEERITDIKDTNRFAVPREIRRKYPILANTNVFAIIKKIDEVRTQSVTELTVIINELRYMKAKARTSTAPSRERVDELYAKKKTLIDTIIFLNTAYSVVDTIFAVERRNADKRRRRWCTSFVSGWLGGCAIDIDSTHYDDPLECGGPLIRKIINEGSGNLGP